jgi:hypothetical protein
MASSGCGTVKQGTPGRMIPAFSRAIRSRVSPRSSMWSNPRLLMPAHAAAAGTAAGTNNLTLALRMLHAVQPKAGDAWTRSTCSSWLQTCKGQVLREARWTLTPAGSASCWPPDVNTVVGRFASQQRCDSHKQCCYSDDLARKICWYLCTPSMPNSGSWTSSSATHQHASTCLSTPQHTSACLSTPQHTSARLSMPEHTSACLSTPQHEPWLA